MKVYFASHPPKFILNIGSFASNSFVSDNDYNIFLSRVVSSFVALQEQFSEFTFFPQTMLPFSFNQGGRSYHNNLTSTSRITDFVGRIKSKICLDISHSALSCEYFKEPLSELIISLRDSIGHFRVSDATALNGEGAKIGMGHLDFQSIHQALATSKSHSIHSLIPEVWKGYLYQVNKFIRSLDKLQNILSEHVA